MLLTEMLMGGKFSMFLEMVVALCYSPAEIGILEILLVEALLSVRIAKSKVSELMFIRFVFRVFLLLF